MLTSTFLFLLSPPSRMKLLGDVLTRASFVLIIASLFLRIGPLAVNVMNAVPKVHAGAATIVTFYPGIPTWFIAETPIGFAFLICTALTGMWCLVTAKKFERYLR